VDARHSDRDALRQEGAALIRKPWLVDAVLGVGLFALAAVIGASYVRTIIDAGGKPRFYQGEFGPAVMAACGRGYLNPDPEHLPALKAFLHLDRDALPCSELGADVAVKPLSPMQVAFRYQEMTIATTWRWTGVSWRGLAPLYGLMFGLSIVAAYALFRTSISVLGSSLGALALAGSTIQLIYLPHFRDYSKAPFLLLAAAVIGWLAKVPLTSRQLIACGAGYGLLLGIGVGFRNDLLIALPPFFLVVLLFLPGGVRERIGVRIATLAACVFAVWVAMLPMRAIYAPGGGNSMQHVVMLGLGDTFNADLGVTNDGLYSWGAKFTDEYAHAQISSHATRMWGASSALEMYGPEYDRSATALLLQIATTFPGDMLTRVYASVLRTLAVPYDTASRNAPTLLDQPTILRGYSFRDGVLRSLGAVWPWAIAATLMGLTLVNLRLALLVLILVFYFSAYPVLQFNERHFFHLEVIAWWALLVCVEGILFLALSATRVAQRQVWRDRFRSRSWLPNVRDAVVAWALALALVFLPLWTSRAYQRGTVRTLLSSYLALEKEPIERTADDIDDHAVRIAKDVAPRASAPSGDAVQTTYVLAEFAAGACESLKFDLVVHYDSSPTSSYDFTRTVAVRPPLAGGVRRVFTALYAHPESSTVLQGAYRFAGFELPRDSVSCLTGLYRVRHVEGLPLVLDANLPPDWESTTPYQTIEGLESRQGGEPAPEIYTFPENLAVGRSLVVQTVEPLVDADIELRSATLETRSDGWRVNGAGGVGGRGPFLYLAQMKPRLRRAGDVLIARGRVERGGLSLGLVQNGSWIAQVPVVATGDFVVVVKVPSDGSYSVVLANNLPGRSLHNQLTIDRIGWVNGG
jgi:hypothetical protein